MLKRHKISVKHALDGIAHAVRTQPNFKVHIVISVFVIVLSIWLKISQIEWIIIGLTIAAGLVIELLNTAVESVVDLITKRFHPLAKVAKDTAAGAMLVFAIASIFIGCQIFLPKIIALLMR